MVTFLRGFTGVELTGECELYRLLDLVGRVEGYVVVIVVEGVVVLVEVEVEVEVVRHGRIPRAMTRANGNPLDPIVIVCWSRCTDRQLQVCTSVGRVDSINCVTLHNRVWRTIPIVSW